MVNKNENQTDLRKENAPREFAETYLGSVRLSCSFMVAAGKANADPRRPVAQNNSLTGVAGGSVTFVASAFNSGATNTNTVSINGMTVPNLPSIWFGDPSLFLAPGRSQPVAKPTGHAWPHCRFTLNFNAAGAPGRNLLSSGTCLARLL